MKESQRIITLFEDLYSGSPWLDVNIMGTLEILTGEQAAKRVIGNVNTIWEIVNHLISWRMTLLERLQGNDVPSPENNYFLPVTDHSSTAWKNTLNQFAISQEKWIQFLQGIKVNDLEMILQGNSFTKYELIHGTLQHDAYHLGQIRILAKLVTT